MPSNDVVDENRTLRFIWPFTAGTLFASEIDDCLWICCFSCPFNQMALNDDRDLRWMQEIYFQTFSQCVPCPQRCVFSLSFCYLRFCCCCQLCVCASVLVCQCVHVFLFLPSVCTSIGRVPVEKGEKRNGEANTVFIHSTKDTQHSHKDTKTMPTNVISKFFCWNSFSASLFMWQSNWIFIALLTFQNLTPCLFPRSAALIWVLPCVGAFVSTPKMSVSKHFLIAFSYRLEIRRICACLFGILKCNEMKNHISNG